MRLLKTRRSKVVTAAVVGATFGVSSMAVAYWTSGGSGTGTASVASTTSNLVITGRTPSDLSPGAKVTPYGEIKNPNSFSVSLEGKYPIVTAVAVDPDHAARCSALDFVIGTGGAAWNDGVNPIPARAGYEQGNPAATFGSTSTITMLDTTQNRDACKGATLSLTWALPS